MPYTIMTSRFTDSWNNPHAVRISRKPYRQKGKGGQPTYPDLWPSEQLFADYRAAKKAGREKAFEPEFVESYKLQLSMLSPQKVYDDLVRIGHGKAVLLCFEDVNTGEFCHRRLVAAWLEKALGIAVPEVVV